MMDKSCYSFSGESTTNSSSSSSSSNRDNYLKHTNKISHKISKPIMRKNPILDHHQQPPQSIQQSQSQSQPQNLQQQQKQNQPPVYSINKSDFRDAVQKLTGSPAHDRLSAPPPIQPPKPPSSRLQKIRPPPLSRVSNHPSPLPNSAVNPNNPIRAAAGAPNGDLISIQRQAVPPLSPLPPLPMVHTAAESPISAYMRFLQSSIATIDSDPGRLSGFSSLAPPQQNVLPQPTSASMAAAPLQFPMPSSPLPFGCFPSPRSPFPLLSPGLLLSPTGQLGFQQFTLSPTLPVPSPRGR